ncbi:MAG: tetraacyldisaccharide 4'-kinase [Sphingobacteriales bacterium]|nr:MAG: tetraacyldisaccharide 4'-kinase [Sphingobacteriales bacterium]TAF80965.1 MAG: tetraacyldisaccharide 4'-kinase [Sphingobacteriales bacterium]
MQFIRYLLYPLSVLYGLGVVIRNKCYDAGLLKSKKFDTPVIVIGNLEVGGSGKTPFTEYLVNLVQTNNNVATLSRGYGRITQGFRWVDMDDDASLCGDESLQIKNNFPDIGVAVCEDRVMGIQTIKDNYEIIILDDAYQHRAVKAGLSILLFDYNSLKNSRLLLPTGNYREPFWGRKRANVLVITKCPSDISESEKATIIKNIKPFAHQKVLLSGIAYADECQALIPKKDNYLLSNISTDTTVLLLTGIAKPELLYTEIKRKTSLVTHIQFADHYLYTQSDINKLLREFKAIKSPKKIILTTQKDAMRLKSATFEKQLLALPIFKVNIKMVFWGDDKLILENTVLDYVNKY